MSRNPQLLNGLGSDGAASDLVPITPSDSTDLTTPARAIRCTGDAGTLRLTTMTGDVRNTTIAAKEVLMVVALRVHATGTDATGLEAMI